MSNKQIFGTSLMFPWALVKHGHGTPGQRPSSAVAYLTEREDGGYLGGYVTFYRAKNNVFPRWHYSYKNPKHFADSDILFIFPNMQQRHDGPNVAQIRKAKHDLSKTPPYQPQEQASVVRVFLPRSFEAGTFEAGTSTGMRNPHLRVVAKLGKDNVS